ncbi:hypothetical protein Dimus_015040 [Dionaea muscipula]
MSNCVQHLHVHVVVVPYPSQGHINPLLQFAKRLASKGVKATLATTRKTVASIHAPNIVVEPISDGFDLEGGSGTTGSSVKAGEEKSFLESLEENGSRTLSQVVDKYRNTANPVTCIVYDAFFPWGLEVAKKHGIYGAAFFTNSATVCAINCCVHHGLLGLPLKPEDVMSVLPKLPGAAFKPADLPSFLRKPESSPAYLIMMLNQFSNLDMADWVFCNSFKELEPQATDGISEKWAAKLIGPLVPSFYLDNRIEGEDRGYGASLWKPLSEQCQSWLAKKPPKSVVYVSFGSMASLTVRQAEEIASALAETRHHFLWVVRESELNKLPQKFRESEEEKGMIVVWCNQLEVLAHPAVGCFVTHCGWNSTLEGLSLGVPMVGLPQWSDQFTGAKFIEEVWGVGVRAKEDDDGLVSKDELLGCLEQVMMEGERSREIKQNALKWKKMAEHAVNEGGSSDKEIDEFLVQINSGN